MAVSDTETDIVSYKPPRGLQTILSFGFFFILLFMVNAIAGAIWLATHNLQTDALIFMLMFATGAVLLFYAGIFFSPPPIPRSILARTKPRSCCRTGKGRRRSFLIPNVMSLIRIWHRWRRGLRSTAISLCP